MSNTLQKKIVEMMKNKYTTEKIQQELKSNYGILVSKESILEIKNQSIIESTRKNSLK